MTTLSGGRVCARIRVPLALAAVPLSRPLAPAALRPLFERVMTFCVLVCASDCGPKTTTVFPLAVRACEAAGLRAFACRRACARVTLGCGGAEPMLRSSTNCALINNLDECNPIFCNAKNRILVVA